MKKQVMIVQRIFPSYRKAIFDRINKKKNMILLHSKNKSGIKQIKTEYSKYIPADWFGKKEKYVFLNIIPSVFKYKPDIIVHEFTIGILSLFFVIILCKILRIKIVLWSHGYNRRTGFHPETSKKDKIRAFLIKISNALLLYTDYDRSQLAKYFDKEKIFVANNTLDTDYLLKIRNKLEKTGKQNIKSKLGFNHKYNIIYIGRLIESKRPGMLIEIYEKLKNKLNNDLCINYVGDGPLLVELQKYTASKNYDNNIIFHGAIFDDQKNGELLFASDLMVLPGELGLSVNHAFCFDTPVVSFARSENGPFHGPESNYIVHGENGYFAKNYDINEITDLIYYYLINEKKQVEIKQNIRQTIEEKCSIEVMEKGYLNCIDKVLNS